MFVYMPAAKACKAYKFARPFYGPYQIIEQSHDQTGVVVCPVDRPQADSIRVAYNRIRHCADSIPDVFWPTRARVTRTKLRKPTGNSVSEAVIQTTDVTSGSRTVTCRLGMKKTEIQLQRRDLKDSRLIH